MALLGLVARAAVGASPISLLGRYAGTYVVDGTSATQSLQIEVEKQHGRRLRVSVFAMNQPEFRGRGKLSKDDSTVTAATRATGKRQVPHLMLTATVSDGGATVAGTFLLKHHGRPDVTGTFSVGR
jgi:hypothetical protein